MSRELSMGLSVHFTLGHFTVCMTAAQCFVSGSAQVYFAGTCILASAIFISPYLGRLGGQYFPLRYHSTLVNRYA